MPRIVNLIPSLSILLGLISGFGDLLDRSLPEKFEVAVGGFGLGEQLELGVVLSQLKEMPCSFRMAI